MTSRRKQKAAKGREQHEQQHASEQHASTQSLTNSQLSAEIDDVLDEIEAKYRNEETTTLSDSTAPPEVVQDETDPSLSTN